MGAHKQLQNKYTVATSSRLCTAYSAQCLKKLALIHVRLGAILYANVYRQPLVATQCAVCDVFSMVKQSKSEGDHYTMLVPKLRMSGIFYLYLCQRVAQCLVRTRVVIVRLATDISGISGAEHCL